MTTVVGGQCITPHYSRQNLFVARCGVYFRAAIGAKSHSATVLRGRIPIIYCRFPRTFC